MQWLQNLWNTDMGFTNGEAVFTVILFMLALVIIAGAISLLPENQARGNRRKAGRLAKTRL